jgi:predicted small integral membrane protein
MKKFFNAVKKTYLISKNWIVENGITGVAGIVLGLILWSFGYKIWAGFSFGVFATRNWDILKNWIVKDILKK